jgi:hypothetical protein
VTGDPDRLTEFMDFIDFIDFIEFPENVLMFFVTGWLAWLAFPIDTSSPGRARQAKGIHKE